MSELRRPQSGRIFGGVCAALAHRFGWNVTVVRVLAVASLLLPGPQVIIYVVAWIVIPAEQPVAVAPASTAAPAATPPSAG